MKKITVKNTRNSRAEIRFVTLACQFKSEITAELFGKEYNAKSIMSTMILEGAEEVVFMIDGPDEAEAEKAIKRYFRGQNNFVE